MSEQGGHKPKFIPAAQVTTRANDGAPPAWAIGIVVATIGFVVLMFALPSIAYAIFPFAHADWFWIGLIFLPMVVLIAVAVAAKWSDFERAQSWTATTGKIVRSELVAKHHRFQGEPETITNVPAVEYEFTTGGRKYRGSRIGIGDDTGGANSEATLARYVLGSDVTVYYDVNDPRNCVLERGGPFAHHDAPLAAAGEMAAAQPEPAEAGYGSSLIFLALVGAIVWLIVGGTDYFEQRFPRGDAKVSVFAACFGLAALMLFLGARRRSKAAQGWPSVRGTIVKSEVEEFWERTDGHSSKSYRAAVEFAYAVRGRDYRGNQIKLDVKVSGSQAGAAKVTAKYPAGGAVDVPYDPANPGRAALENPTGMTWLILAVAAACFALTAYTLGVFK
jgi:hypothetical protein